MWGLNTVLREDGLNLKNREDHRHHAVDAVVIALTDRSRLQHLARARYTDERLPAPWSNFRDAIEEAAAGIHVSHKAVRDISGALHEETIYGPTSKPDRGNGEAERPHAKGWIEEDGVFVLRKKLEDLTPAMVENIRDPHVKEIVLQRLAEFGVEPGGKGKIPKEAWQKPLYMKRKSGRTSRAPSMIRKVRIVRKEGTIQPIRGGAAWVKPGNTHHIAIFELPAKAGKKPKRDMIAVSMMEASQRARRGEPLVSRVHPSVPDAKFLFSLSWGEMVSADIRGRDDLYVFRTAASTQGQIYFVSHTDARPSASATKFAVKANTLAGQKVIVDPLGRIRNAND
jgi:CRISPR-associated endonuclease Csn1